MLHAEGPQFFIAKDGLRGCQGARSRTPRTSRSSRRRFAGLAGAHIVRRCACLPPRASTSPARRRTCICCENRRAVAMPQLIRQETRQWRSSVSITDRVNFSCVGFSPPLGRQSPGMDPGFRETCVMETVPALSYPVPHIGDCLFLSTAATHGSYRPAVSGGELFLHGGSLPRPGHPRGQKGALEASLFDAGPAMDTPKEDEHPPRRAAPAFIVPPHSEHDRLTPPHPTSARSSSPPQSGRRQPCPARPAGQIPDD